MILDESDPMSHDHPNRPSEPALPDDVRDVASLLDRAAATTRAMPDASFESRMAMRTRPVPARVDESHPLRPAAHVDAWGSHRNARPLWAARVAAALAVAGGVIAAWMGTQPPSSPSAERLAPGAGPVAASSADVADDLELAFAIAGLGDDTDSSLDELLQQAESIDSTIRQGLDMTDLFGEDDAT